MSPHMGRLKANHTYGLRLDRKPALWWFLTSRRLQAWDEHGIADERQENWDMAWTMYKHSSPFAIWVRKWGQELSWDKLDCGCSYNIWSGKFTMYAHPCSQNHDYPANYYRRK